METSVPRLAPPLKLPAFGEIKPARLLAVDDLFAVVQDKFPISPGHTLIIARRPVARFQELTSPEKARLFVWIDWTQLHLASNLNPTPDAFNLGLNDGPAAGQTMPQLHFHVIPRYTAGCAVKPICAFLSVSTDQTNRWPVLLGGISPLPVLI